MPTVGEILVRVGIVSGNLASEASGIERRFDAMGQRLSSLGSRITFGVSAPLTGLLGAIGKFGMDFDRAMTESLAIMNHVQPQMRKQMEETAFAVASTTKFSAEKAAEAYYDLASAGLSAEDAMGSLQTVAQFAQAGVMDLSVAGDYLAGAVTAVGDKALGTTGKIEGMARMADILTAANNSALGTVEDFAKAISTRAGGAINQYGLSVEQGVSALMAFASQNIKGQRAGEQMYIALRDLQKASQKNAETWKQHGIEVYTASGQLRSMGDIINQIAKYTEGMSAQQKFAAISLLGFQDKSRGAIQAILGMGNEMQRFEGILKESGGTAKRVADEQMGAFSNQVKQMYEQVKILGIRLFQDLLPILKNDVLPALKDGTAILGGFLKMFTSLPAPIKQAMLALAGFFAVLGPGVYVLGGFISSLSVIGTAISVPMRAIQSLGMAVYLTSNYLTAAQAATLLYGRSIGGLVAGVTGATTAVAAGVKGWAAWSKAASASLLSFLTGAGAVTAGAMNLGQAVAKANPALAAMGATAKTTSNLTQAVAGSMNAAATAAGLAAAVSPKLGIMGSIMAGVTKVWAGFLGVGAQVLAFIPRLLGPWGLVATAIVTAGVALYKWKTNSDGAMESMKRNADQMLKTESTLIKVALRYQELSHKVNLTKDEKEELRRATEELAKWTGYSAEGLQRETARSDDLINSLIIQAQQRWNVVEAAKEQLALDVQSMRIQKEQMREAANNLRRRANAIAGGTEPITGPGGRTATADDRKSAIQRELDKANEFEQRIKELDATMRGMGWGVKSGDIKLGTPAPAPPPGVAGKPTSDFKIPDIAKTGKEVREHHERQRKSLLTEFLIDLADMNTAVNEAFEQNVPMPVILDAWGTEIEGLEKKAKAWGMTLVGNINTVARAGEQLNFKEWFAIFDANSPLMQLDDQDIAWMNDISQKAKDEAEKLQQITRKANLEAADSSRSRRDIAIQAIKDEEAAEIEKLVVTRAENRKYYDEAVAAIQKKSAFEIAKINETADTIVERMRDAGVHTVDSLNEMEDTARRTFEQMGRSGKFAFNQLEQAWDNWADSAMRGGFLANFRKPLAEVTREVQQLVQTMGDAAPENLKFAANLLGAGQAALTAGDMMAKGFFKISDGFDMVKAKVAGGGAMMAKGMLDMAAGMISGVSAMASATSGTDLGKSMLGGATTGALMGASVTVGAMMLAGMKTGLVTGGIWGAVAGAIVGIMVAYFRGKETRSLMKRVGEEWGGSISEGLAEAIKKDSRRFGDRVAATLFNMSDVISELGGWEANLEKNVGKIRDVFVMLSRGLFTTAEASKVLSENFPDVIAAIEKMGKIAPPVIAEIIRLNREMGVMNAEVIGVVLSQTQKFGEALATAFGPITKKYGSLKTDMEAAAKALSEAKTELAEDNSAENRDAVSKAQAELNRLLELQAEGARTAGDELARMGRLALAGFNAAIAGGVGIVGALDAVGPALASLKSMYEGLGISYAGTPFEELLNFQQLAADNRELVDAAGALNQMMMALSITGGLTADSLRDIEAQGMQTFNALITAGFTENQAIAMMADYLGNVYEAHARLGIPIDENTARLIAQGIEMGVIQDETLSLNNILMEGLAALITALGGKVPAAWQSFLNKATTGINVLDNHIEQFADGIADKFDEMPTLKIPYEYHQIGDEPRMYYPEDPDRPGDGERPDVPELANGGIVYGPTLAMIGEREAEVVRPLRDDLNRSDRQDNTTYIILDGKKVGSSMAMKYLPQALRNHAVNRLR
jgi:TP901 family phage tail tape measure protein